MTFRFIAHHTGEFPVNAMCRTLQVSRSGFYRWRRAPTGKRQAWREDLAKAVVQAHQQSRGTYGSPRVHRALLASGRSVCRNSVAKIMQECGLKSRRHRRFRLGATDSRHDHPVAPNLLDRRFHPTRLNRVWLTDITCIPTAEGLLYLAGVMDLCSRRIIGWSMAEHCRAELAIDALGMALRARGLWGGLAGPGGLLHHSDRGVQYACADYQALLRSHHITVSMSRVGDCYDNAPAESFWATLKTELVHQRPFATRAQARAAIFDYIEVFYNRQRQHSALGYVSPERFEATLV